MNNIKRLLGYVWMIMGPAVIIFLLWQAVDKIGLANSQVQLAVDDNARALARSIAVNTILQWCIIIAVFLPIAMGMVIFGRYAVDGAYDRLPESSDELELN